MRPKVNSNWFEISNRFEMSSRLHGNLEHIYMRPGVNLNRFEILLQSKISLRCDVTSFTSVWYATSIVRMHVCAAAILHCFASKS